MKPFPGSNWRKDFLSFREAAGLIQGFSCGAEIGGVCPLRMWLGAV